MFKTKVPLGLRTRRNSFARAKNQSTYWLGLIPPYARARLSAYGGEVTIRSKNPFGYSRRTSAQSPNRFHISSPPRVDCRDCQRKCEYAFAERFALGAPWIATICR